MARNTEPVARKVRQRARSAALQINSTRLSLLQSNVLCMS
jgi:hypothetical protein